MTLRPLTDKDIRDVLVAIDASEKISVTTLEAEFLDTAGGKWLTWSVEQRGRAAQIAEKYRNQL